MFWAEKKNDMGNVEYVFYYCPGCKRGHSVPIPRWEYNGNVEKPTLSPSVRHYIPAGNYGPEGKPQPEQTECHYFIRNGQFEFCGDCEHELKGQTVPLPNFPEGYSLPI